MKTLITLIIGFGLILSIFADSPTKPAKQPPMSPHVYKIDPQMFADHLKTLLPPREGESNQKLLLRYIKQKQIKLPRHSSIVLDEKEGKLVVTTTPAVRAEIDMLVQEICKDK